MTHRIGILIFDGMTLLDASGPAEVFRLADPSHETYKLEFISPAGGTVRASSGMQIASTRPAADVGPLDTLLIGGGEKLVHEDLGHDLLTAAVALAVAPRRVASVCTGAFVLAKLGYLDQRRATTHWRHAHTLSRRYPNVTVEPDVIHIQDGRYITSAGITAGIDLALAMVEDDMGSETARTVARELVMFMQRPGGQTQFSTALQMPPVHNATLKRLMNAVITNPAAELSPSTMASAMGVSIRHLNRVFRSEADTTPARWLEKVRVDAARTLILEGHPVARVAQLSGFGNDETLRRAFDRHLGTTPTAFRRRFTTARVGADSQTK